MLIPFHIAHTNWRVYPNIVVPWTQEKSSMNQKNGPKAVLSSLLTAGSHCSNRFPDKINLKKKIQVIPRAQALAPLPLFLEKFAKSIYKAGGKMVHSEKVGISSWLEALQYLLRNYDQSSRIRSALTDL